MTAKAAEERAAFEEWLHARCPHDLGSDHAYGFAVEDHPGDVWWLHRCTDGRLVLGRIDVTSGTRHAIIERDPLTVGGGSGSVLCVKCGDHGFIRRGRWEPA